MVGHANQPDLVLERDYDLNNFRYPFTKKDRLNVYGIGELMGIAKITAGIACTSVGAVDLGKDLRKSGFSSAGNAAKLIIAGVVT